MMISSVLSKNEKLTKQEQDFILLSIEMEKINNIMDEYMELISRSSKIMVDLVTHENWNDFKKKYKKYDADAIRFIEGILKNKGDLEKGTE